MRYFTRKFATRNTQSKIAPTHRGSVLILVVVLCVLLALMGTALLSTTRNDRYVSAQNSANTGVDLLLEGVKQIAISTIVDPTNRFDAQNWNWDMPHVGDGIPTTATQHDLWLSPRLPAGVESGGASIGTILWPTVGMLPSIPFFTDPKTGGTYFIRADATAANTPNSHHRLDMSAENSGPTWKQTKGALTKSYGAADADGDGIADAGFFTLPVGELDGVTYYAALRIIDNNSAVNVNTALSSQSDFDLASNTNWIQQDAVGGTWSATSINLGTFRSHVGLKEMLSDYDPNWANPAMNKEFVALTTYRNNGTTPSTTAYDSAGAPIGGVNFTTRGDMYDQLLADRLLNPGFPDSTKKALNPFMISDAQSLIYHFTLANLSSGSSSLERALAGAGAATFDSIHQSAMNVATLATNSSVKGRKAYSPGRYLAWYDENFNYAGLPGTGLTRTNTIVRPIRSLLTTYNPVSNQIVPKTLTGGTLPAGMAPYRYSTTTPKGAPVKTNINTAKFDELYRAFWCVMSDNLTTTMTPYPDAFDPATGSEGIYRGMKFNLASAAVAPNAPDVNSLPHPQRMFRSSIRDPHATGTNVVRFSDGTPGSSGEQLKLRAAAAATQAIYLRDHTQTSQTIQLMTQGSAAGPVNVKLFPVGSNPDAAQPFIVEVFAWWEKNATPPPPDGPLQAPPYVAIALYNPFPVNVTLDGSWQIRAFRRTLAQYTPPFSDGRFSPIVALSPFSTPVTIPPDGILIIDNYDSGGLMSSRPTSSGFTDLTGSPGSLDGSKYQYMSITGLDAVLNNEMILTQDVSGPGSVANTKPIDSFDFTGFDRNAVAGLAWHYERPYGTAERRWQCVYPGRYDGNSTTLRHQGTEQAGPWSKAAGESDPWTTSHTHLADGATKVPTYPSLFSIQLANKDWPGPNAGTNKFPFGGFARNGDILQVPFIAAYTISNAGGQVIDMNSISMDAAFAEDSDVSDDYPNYNPNWGVSGFPRPAIDAAGEREQIGRFCPIRTVDSSNAVTVNDYETDPTRASYDVAGATPIKWHYRWTKNLFNYLTVQSPGTDYMPNDPAAITSGSVQPVDNDGDKTVGIEDGPTAPTAPAGYTYSIGAEDTVGVQGLININTAPWKVLAAIPWVPRGLPLFDWWGTTAPPGTDNNDMIAKAIVQWRDGDPSPTGGDKPGGPFKSIFDLYGVTAKDNASAPYYLFQKLQQEMVGAFPGAEPGVAQGDFSGKETGEADGVRNDFEEQYLLLTKVSNLLTTRSDTFTVYILLQGWRGAGGANPSKVVERRAAMIVDRTSATKENPAKVLRWDIPND